jgi:hypothetical protein
MAAEIIPNEVRAPASTAQVPLFALFAWKRLAPFGTFNSNNAKGGTISR